MGGGLHFLQPIRGYRFAVDALLLAGFARLKADDLVLDFGAGCGVVGLILAWANPAARLICLELQPALAELAWRNAHLNRLQDRVAVLEGDLRREGLFSDLNFDVIAANPPYRPAGSGRLGPVEQRNLARHELKSTLNDWLQAARRWLKPQGRLYVVYPVWRLTALLSHLRRSDLTPKRLRLVYTRPGGPGRLALVEARAGGREELKVAAPFFIHAGSSQGWSAEMDHLAQGRLLGAI